MQEIEINDRSFLVDPTDYDYFWPQFCTGQWETETFKTFDTHIDAETLVIDIGAWVGPTVLYSAQLAAKCVAFEPDPIAFKRLRENVALNENEAWRDRLSIYEQAISPQAGQITLGSQKDGGDSMSSVLFADRQTSWSVEAIKLETVFDQHADAFNKIFLKIDIEGAEYDLIPEISHFLADDRVTALISLHPHFLRRSIKKSFGKVFGMPRFLQTRKEYLRIYRGLVDALPNDRKVTIDCREYTSYHWLLINAFVRMNSPLDIVIQSK